jgi:ribosomal protein S18 acetylase RimI-like enzyme
MAIEIRRATREDAPFLAWVILAASRSHLDRGWFDIVLQLPERNCLEFLQRLCVCGPRSWWHYSYFLMAEHDGVPVAALCAFRAGDAYPLSAAAMAETANALSFGDTEQQAMWARGGYVFTCTFGDDDDLWTIENVATLPQYRGRGLTGRLLEHAVHEGIRSGATNAQITFLIGNEAAERAYAKAGFVLDGERRHRDFEAATGAPGLRRYVRRLVGVQ